MKNEQWIMSCTIYYNALFKAGVGGETPLFWLIIILIQSTNLHTSLVWPGAWLKIITLEKYLNAKLTTEHAEHAAVLKIIIHLFRATDTSWNYWMYL